MLRGERTIITDPPQIIIHVVDDDANLLDSIRDLLHLSGYTVITYQDAKGFLDFPPPLSPGCIVLDLLMPEVSGLEVQNALGKVGCKLPVIFLTGHEDADAVISAFRAGATDFLRKPASTSTILNSITESVTKSFAIVKRERTLAILTPRERQVAELMISNRPNKVISHQLGISEKTVEFHRKQIMNKLAISHVSQLYDLLHSEQDDIGTA